MLSGHRSGWRRRRNSRAARIAVPLAIPMALGLTLGIILAVSGNNTTTVEQSALGSCASAAASAPAPAASGSQAAPAAGASAPASAAAAPSPCPSASGSGAPAQAAADNTDCDIIVPANPLSAQGLATPYQLTGTNGASPEQSGCTMANFGNLGAFVQATILDPATGKLSVYEPLVITKGRSLFDLYTRTRTTLNNQCHIRPSRRTAFP